MSRKDKEEPLFGEVISEYPDAQAVEDGVLGDVSRLDLKTSKGNPVNRITASINQLARKDGDPAYEDRLRKMVAACARESDGWFIADEFEGDKLWLVDNEVDGYTLMRPSDY